MTWRRVFRARLYVRDSLWVLPLAGAMLGAVLGSVDIRIEQSVHVPAQFQYSGTTASTVLAAIVGAMAALTGFVVTAIMRRLRAMLEELHGAVLPEFRAAVADELARLDATVAQSFGGSVDFDRARTADTQGIGGPRTRPADHAAAR
jgi:hypothetical protein